ncbi:hypothetical protein COT44_03720 [Candidatus Shapirobacteria bacterium CG08_land_8_20_14_0_20_39_18]|uniref:Nudix hydrolase domain-containing protein n=1 Tax=Candidatus Shapirobacteria bacterium CG08_land_8_20_14_0_20_39_18 TaxID=1974883 RepID=A0A2M6XCA1_9BACT|nr:MAG: hypothetical protein COT44_03720 [Candidatus Shapirobacteria bacterium CG08_land_8_20_14_0_20_39_18]PIY64744.1 MAG: hypothetical protein COY91_04395 [Candidatus Shapirobacteria bacterium CG_4_10_14_0_8_um_filter_39_15]PJE67970.1 MAG: hypothetical protein COU94_04360 [Candidatus Shapirobacteria bacterium CG10_big_fil_rev_8_21_14_0_10_38_8]
MPEQPQESASFISKACKADFKAPAIQESPSFINLAVTLNSEGEVLVIKRVKKEIGANGKLLEWAFPGGKQHTNESRKECVEKEVLDETGYKVVSDREISMRVPQEFHIILVYHLCHLAEEKPVTNPAEQWEVEEVKWVAPTELKTLFTTQLNPAVAKELGI